MWLRSQREALGADEAQVCLDQTFHVAGSPPLPEPDYENGWLLEAMATLLHS